MNKRERPRDFSYHHQGLLPAVLAMRKLSVSRAASAQLTAIERRLRAGDAYSQGLLNPLGIR